jgi:NAD(P)H-flavin reductase
VQARIETVYDETPTIKTLTIKPRKSMEFVAGQFVQLSIPGVGEAPFTPSGSPHITEYVQVSVLRTGVVTNALHELEPGALLGMRGPLGRGFPVDRLPGKDILIVGGGVGLAPLRSLLYHLFHSRDDFGRIDIRYGARSPAELLFHNEYERWSSVPGVSFQQTVDVPDEKWTGSVGVVTTLLNEFTVDRDTCLVFMCGPSIMFKFVTATLLEHGIDPHRMYLSMNRRMSCGIGMCGRCNIGPYYICKDGPDMQLSTIMEYSDVF